MRFNEFNTINEDVLTEQELVVESALIDFLEDTITKQEFLSICEEQGITENPLGLIARGGAKLYNKYGDKAKIPKDVSEILEKAVNPEKAEKADKPDKNDKPDKIRRLTNLTRMPKGVPEGVKN